ncbi:class I SAM-dependent methyltransferase [Janibacter sp. G1551]|uniref:class I SAM-dependent methyltransferase n=1 Tax=Janibacter sp. G1551 TaxID=3420440 RepID=UPI003CFD1A0D
MSTNESGGDHYFTADPASDGERRRIGVELAGRRVDVEVAPGIFNPQGVDKGTRILLAEVPDPPTEGTFLDLGCGWGPIALTLGLLAPAAQVWAVDVNRRALDLTRRNATTLGLGGIHAVEAHEVPEGATFDVIWSNPPIRVGKAVLHDLMLTWLPRLAPGGRAFLVVQKNLGSDSLQEWLEAHLPDGLTVGRWATSKGFRVLVVEWD